MILPPLLEQRLKKLADNPYALVHFLKKRLYYNFIADYTLRYYKDIQYRNPTETLDIIIKENKSIIRFGDGEFDIICGVGVYFNDWHQQYDKKLKERLEEIMSSQEKNILICFNLNLIFKTKQQFKDEGIISEYHFWTVAKSILHKYIHPETLYGSGLCFYPAYNPSIDFQKLKIHFSTKEIVIITNNTERFKHIQLGKQTHFLEAPKSNSWQEYSGIQKTLDSLIKEKYLQKETTLFLVSMGSAAKVLVYDLAKEGYTAWDTGQFFDFANKEIEKLNQEV